MVDELSIVGQRLPRKEAARKVTGQLKFYSDLCFPDMLYMKILRSPYAHAKILSIDTSKAKALSGVRAVITHEDVPAVLLNYPDLVHILDDRVFFAGCEVAAVVAINEEVAEEATKLIDVEYQQLPVLLDPEDTLDPGAPEIHPGTPNLIFGQPIVVGWGDAAGALAASDHVIEESYYTQPTFNAACENHGCVAFWDSDDNLTIWTGTQGVFGIREVFAPALELPINKVRVIQCHQGGGFGGKYYHMRHIGMASILSKKTRKPVKIVLDKEDEFQRCNSRHEFYFDLKSGINNDGSLTGIEANVISNTGAYFADSLGVHYVSMGPLDLYPYPNVDWYGQVTYSNRPTAGAFRGYGNLQANYAFAIQTDRMIEAIGADPLEWRKQHSIKTGDPHGGGGAIISSCALNECIDKGAQAIGWAQKFKGFGVPYQTDGSVQRGVGVSAGIHVGVYGYDMAIVKILQDGTVQLLTGAADCGMGGDTVTSMICAETLKVSYEAVSVLSCDTAVTGWCSPSVASRVTCTNGNAVKLAAEDALRQLIEAAAPILEVAPEDLEAENGEIFVKASPNTRVSYGEVMATVSPPVIVAYGRWGVPTDHSIQGFAAQFVDVAVDVDTGEVKVLKIACAHDVGRAINKNTLDNQILGGAIGQGLGMAISEDCCLDKASGVLLNANFLDYGIPTTAEMPETECILVEPVDPIGPYGAKGCSEIAIVPTVGAVSNAVYNAIGARINVFPISPNRVLKALGKV